VKPSSESGACRPQMGGDRNQWPASTGLRGHHVPDSVAAFARIMHPAEVRAWLI
jgi:hypothetical protein